MKTLFFILACIISFNTLAVGQANQFYVDLVRVDKSGKGYVKFKERLASSGGLPGCGTSHPHHLAFDTNTSGGKGILSLALSAKAANQKIWARGTGDCSGIYGSVENWSWGYVL